MDCSFDEQNKQTNNCLSIFGQMTCTRMVCLLLFFYRREAKKPEKCRKISHDLSKHIVKQCREWEIVFFLHSIKLHAFP